MKTFSQWRYLPLQAAIGATMLLLSLSGWAATPSTDEMAPVTISSPEGAYEFALVAARSGDFATADKLMRGALEANAFKTLDVRQQLQQLMMATGIAMQLKDFARAQALAVQATELPIDEAPAWQMRVSVNAMSGNFSEAARSLAVVIKRWPEALRTLDKREAVRYCAEALKLPNTDAAYELLQAMQATDWAPLPNKVHDQYNYQLARLALDRGHTDLAKASAAKVTSAGAILLMQIDRRFLPIVAADPGRFSVERAAAADVAQRRAAVAEDSKSLEAVLSLNNALIVNRQCSEALAIVDAALKNLRGNDPGSSYRDVSLANGIMEGRSRSLACLGRWDEAVTQMIEASKQPDKGSSNVNQALNLASIYTELHRPDDALNLLKDFDSQRASAYGKAVIESIRHAVAIQRRDAAEIDRTEKYLAANQVEAPMVFVDSLADSGKLDELATATIRYMRNPETRAMTLATLQDYSQPPQSPYEKAQLAIYKSLRERSDVKAAVQEYGRIGQFKIHRPPGL